jgi:hypothetical protein
MCGEQGSRGLRGCQEASRAGGAQSEVTASSPDAPPWARRTFRTPLKAHGRPIRPQIVALPPQRAVRHAAMSPLSSQRGPPVAQMQPLRWECVLPHRRCTALRAQRGVLRAAVRAAPTSSRRSRCVVSPAPASAAASTSAQERAPPSAWRSTHAKRRDEASISTGRVGPSAARTAVGTGRGRLSLAAPSPPPSHPANPQHHRLQHAMPQPGHLIRISVLVQLRPFAVSRAK